MSTTSRNTTSWRTATVSLVFVSLLATLYYIKMSLVEDPSKPPTNTNSTSDSAQSPAPTNNDKKVNGGPADSKKSIDGSSATAGAPKLDGAALKAQKKAEKAARRAQEVLARQVGSAAPTPGPPQQEAGQAAKSAAKSGKDNTKVAHRRTGSTAAEGKSLAMRGGKVIPQEPKLPPKEDKTVELFRHLYKVRATTIAGASKDVHPAVLALGQQMSSYVICGSNARLVATMQAFKRVIESYTTPPGNTLTRHFIPHVLSHQIDYLTSCRPLSVSMGTAIRWLKVQISKVEPDTSDTDAKESLCESIDEFVQHRVTLADQVIAELTSTKEIKDGDVILTYAKSSIVQQSLALAHAKGIKFRVIVVDSRPLFEGRALAESLANLGIEVKYSLMSGLVHCIGDATKVLLGAHAMMSNGRLFSRVGSAQVAMEAKDINIPVLVLCESIKCTERVALDSIVLNEVAPPDELVLPSKTPGKAGTLAGWQDTKHLQLLNLMYDVTPADSIDMIVTELGIVPPSSVPVLQRLANEGQ